MSGGGDERWLITYADMITLLMVFFIVLFAMARVDLDKYEKLAHSLNQAFGAAGQDIFSVLGTEAVGQWESEFARPAQLDFPVRSAFDQVDVSRELGVAIARAGMEGEVSVRTVVEGVIVSLSAELIFAAGSAEIQPTGEHALDDIAGVLATMINPLRVEAHTDDRSTNNPMYPTNWELSTARAVSIVRHLIEAGIAPARLSAAGFAAYQPLVPNDTPEHRALNRRATIVILYPMGQRSYQIDLLPELQEFKQPVLLVSE